MSRNGNTTLGRVTVVFADPHHTLKLVEARAKLRSFLDDEGNLRYRVDRTAAEAYARARLVDMGLEPKEPWKQWQFVGILVAHPTTSALERGRITWGVEVETQEAVEV